MHTAPVRSELVDEVGFQGAVLGAQEKFLYAKQSACYLDVKIVWRRWPAF